MNRHLCSLMLQCVMLLIISKMIMVAGKATESTVFIMVIITIRCLCEVNG